MDGHDRLRPFVPQFVVEWLRTSPSTRHRAVEGTLAFVDVSGFTRLTERLALRGKVGAEEMTGLLDRTFAELLAVAYAHGAWLVKWGGDAVLLLFEGDDHARRAGTATLGMRRTMGRVGRLQTSCGPVRLRVSTGVHSGTFDFFLVGGSHRELVISGPGATTTAETEAAADAGQVAVSRATAALLSPALLGRRDDGVLLLERSPGSPVRPEARAVDTGGVDLGTCLPAATRRHLLSSGAEAEHRLVSVAFVEFSGMDALLSEQGPGAATAAVDAVVRACQDAAVRHGVTFWETDICRDGGKVMLVAGVPGSTGADEDAMLAVARDVVDSGGALRLRVGVNTGRVFSGEFGPPYRRTLSVKGDAVNLAARLLTKAAPGEVLATAAVLRRTRTPFRAEALPPFHVKGKTQSVVASRVGRPHTGTAVEHTGPDGAEPVPLVGRRRELARLHADWRRARPGQLRSCDLVGEPGAGKSRLVRELCGQVGARVVAMRCDPYTAASAYSPLRRVVRTLLGVPAEAPAADAGPLLLDRLGAVAPDLLPWAPLLGTVLGADVPDTPETRSLDERFRVRRQEETTADLLRRLLPDPAVLVVDDAHLLDPSTAALLDRLPELAPAAPWLVVRCRREDTARRGPAREGARRLDVGPLDPESALALLHAVTDEHPLAAHEAEALVRRSGGNPLFLIELATAASRGAGLADLPDTVEGVVTARIDRLPPPDRALLRAAAVLGREVDTDVLGDVAARAALPLDDAALGRLDPFLERAGPRSRRFRLPLVQETAYEGLPYARRTLLHGLVGDVLVERAGDRAEEQAGVLSLHFLRAQRDEEAWRHANSAAGRAHGAMAHAEAAELYERALAAARTLPVDGAGGIGDEVALTWEALGDVRCRLGQFSAASSAYDEARRRLEHRPVDRARLHLKTARCCERSGTYRQALRWLTGGQRLLESAAGDRDDPTTPMVTRLAAELRVARATVRHWQGRHQDAARECRQAIPLAQEAGALDVLADTLVWLDVSELRLGRGDGSHARTALDLLRGLGDRPWQVGRCLNEIGIRAYYAGDWDGALSAYRASRASVAEAGDTWAVLTALANEAEILSDQGRLAEAEPLLRDALRGARASAAPGFVAFVTGLLGQLAARAGRSEAALETLRSARAQHEAIGEVDEAAEVDVRIAEALALAGRGAEALAAVTAVDEATARSLAPLVLRVRGWGLALLDRHEQAETVLTEGLETARERGAGHETALTLHALAALALARGRHLPGDLEEERASLLAGLGVVAVAEPLLPRRARVPRQASPAAGRSALRD